MNTSSKANQGYDAFADELRQTQFNKIGALSSILITPNIKHFVQDGHSLIQQPHIMTYGNKGVWNITSDTATANSTHTEIHLIGHVVMIQPATPTTPKTVIKTNQATVFPKRSYAMTRDYVSITRADTVMTGIGATADMKQGIIKLLSHTRGHYAPSPKN